MPLSPLGRLAVLGRPYTIAPKSYEQAHNNLHFILRKNTAFHSLLLVKFDKIAVFLTPGGRRSQRQVLEQNCVLDHQKRHFYVPVRNRGSSACVYALFFRKVHKNNM